ncbi:MAG: TerC/Alx family metal homeostasis membrane protein [Actinobacteria bacterium]|nr:TerC/Alx family metal homeostasis membrane protein [Actinomycetota bacterium]
MAHLQVTPLAWGLTIGLIVALLALDLVLGAVRPHRIGFGEAARWSAFYILVAIGFGAALAFWADPGYSAQFFAGYLVEKSLSVDNLFVFLIIMTTFAVPARHQQKVLSLGIVLALVMRVAFILAGAALLDAFSFMFLVFGLVLVWTAIQLYRNRGREPEVGDNLVVRLTRRVLPVTAGHHDGRLLARVDEPGGGRRRAVTPLFVALVAIGGSDLLFAFDSIPAVFGVTDEPFLVFAANAFALLGLRALYFLVAGLLDRLVHLSTGLALILAFIGVKLALHWGHTVSPAVPEIPTWLSLVVIVAVLAATTVASLRAGRREEPTAESGSAAERVAPVPDRQPETVRRGG